MGVGVSAGVGVGVGLRKKAVFMRSPNSSRYSIALMNALSMDIISIICY